MTSSGEPSAAARGGDHILATLKSIRAARPGSYRIFVIADNLSVNKALAIRANVGLCFTPVIASWANPKPSSGRCGRSSWAMRMIDPTQ